MKINAHKNNCLQLVTNKKPTIFFTAGFLLILLIQFYLIEVTKALNAIGSFIAKSANIFLSIAIFFAFNL